MVDDWPSYNEALVRRGIILLNLDLLKDWGDEVEEMNRGKAGGRYRYPHSRARRTSYCASRDGIFQNRISPITRFCKPGNTA